jgi:hypothetical protein
VDLSRLAASVFSESFLLEEADHVFNHRRVSRFRLPCP